MTPALPARHWTVYAKLVGTAFCWGGTFIAGRLLAQALPHMVVAASRFVLASALLLLVARKLEGGLPKLNKRQWFATAVLGATGIFIYNICFFGALEVLPAGRTALIVALNPIVTALAMALLLGERLSPTRWFGIALAFVGAAIVVTRGNFTAALSQSVGKGELMMFVGACAWAVYTIVGQRALRGLSPIAATAYAALWGTLFLSLGALPELGAIRWAAIDITLVAALLYLAVFGTVLGFIWYYQGVRAIGPARTSVFNNLVPVFGVTLAALLLREPILMSMIVGGLLVILGVTLTNRPTKRA